MTDRKREFIRSKAPFRISFGGGGTDVPPYCWERGGAVVSTTINKYAHVSLEPINQKSVSIRAIDLKIERSYELKRLEYGDELDLVKAVINEFEPSKGLDITIKADMPPGSGMGTSSSMVVSVIGCLAEFVGKSMDKSAVAELAYHIEREELGQRGGYQDQYAAAFGGFNYMEFSRGGVRVTPLSLRPGVLRALRDRLLLFFVGKTRMSSEIHMDMAKRYALRKKTQRESLDRLKEIAEEMRERLLRGDLTRFGELLHEGWVEKRVLSEMITTPEIETLYEKARKKGAAGGKILGAGGGGHLLLFCEPERRFDVLNELVKYGVREVPFRFEHRGLQVWKTR